MRRHRAAVVLRAATVISIATAVVAGGLPRAHADDGAGAGSGSGSTVSPDGIPVEPDAGTPILGPDGKPVVTPEGDTIVAPDQAPTATETSGDTDLELSYLWDGGMIPFVYVAGAGVLAFTFVKPPDTPRLFSEDEGGATPSSWEVPGWSVTALGAGLGAAILFTGNPSRWYHTKGLAEALATGALLTGALKVTFGRRRPDWVSNDVNAGNRSFPSGHATQAFAIGTYALLYLRFHAFNNYRPENTILWWEAALDVAILGAATAFTAERVIHNRHHKSDILVGALLGSISSMAFFAYQERRYRRRHGNPNPVKVIPSKIASGYGLELTGSF